MKLRTQIIERTRIKITGGSYRKVPAQANEKTKNIRLFARLIERYLDSLTVFLITNLSRRNHEVKYIIRLGKRSRNI